MLQRRSVRWLSISLLLCAITLPFIPQSGFASTHAQTNTTAQPSYVPGQLIVKVAPAAQSATVQSADPMALFNATPSLNALNNSYGVFAIAAALAIDAGDELASQLGLDRVYLVSVPPETDIWAMAAAYNSDPNVEYAEPSTLLPQDQAAESITRASVPNGSAANASLPNAPVFPNDPFFQYQDALNNIGQNGGSLGADVDAPEAWELQTGSADVLIAVLDTGVHATHPDLQGKIRHDLAFDFLEADQTPQDDDSHGTRVASVIAAEANNGIDITGVCWGCQIVPLRVGTWVVHVASLEVAQAIYYATSVGVDVINMSLGGQCSDLWADVVNYAYASDVVMVAAAGNEVGFVTYPARFDRVVGVSAVDHNDLFAGFSSFGPSIDLAAPGVNVAVSDFLGVGIGSGTTYASAITSGIAGLLRSANPALTNGQVRQILRSTALDLGDPGFDPYYGFGRVNARSALDAAQSSPPSIALPAFDVCGCVLGDLAEGTTVPQATVAASGEDAPASLDATSVLYRVRDELFATSELGTEITSLYYRHAPQVAMLAYHDETLRQQLMTAMQNGLPYALSALEGEGEMIVDASLVAQASELVTALAARANPELRGDLLATWQSLDLASYVERPVSDVIDHLRAVVQRKQLFLPMLTAESP